MKYTYKIIISFFLITSLTTCKNKSKKEIEIINKAIQSYG